MKAKQRLRIEKELRLKRIRLVEANKSKSDNELAAEIRVAADGFLLSPEWRAIRKLALEKHGSCCLKCGRMGTPDEPINVDHIKPRKFFPELALDLSNLQPLCWRCNKAKGNREADYRHHP